MKLNAAYVQPLLIAAAIGLAAVPLTAKPTPPAPQPQEEAAAPAAEGTEATIPGQNIQRANGGFLSLSIEGNSFKLAFFDKDKKQVDADVARATARWDAKYKHGDERRVLNPSGDGKTLVSTPIRPPFVFKLFLNLLSEDGTVVETHVIDFRG